jgi:hypothetical protein
VKIWKVEQAVRDRLSLSESSMVYYTIGQVVEALFGHAIVTASAEETSE